MANNDFSDKKQSTTEQDSQSIDSKDSKRSQNFEWHHEPQHHESFNWHHEPQHHKSFNWHHEPWSSFNWHETFTDRWY